MSVDLLEVAKKAYKDARHYHQTRDRFSTEIVSLVLHDVLEDASSRENSDSQITVLELAAGTGTLTEGLHKALLDTNVRLVCSEPIESMAKVFQENFPQLEFILCRAEKIPLPDSSVDLIVSGGALRYLNTPSCYDEISRVLKPGGGLAFIASTYDPAKLPWYRDVIQKFTEVFIEKGMKVHLTKDGVLTGWEDVLDSSGYFTEVTISLARHTQPCSEQKTLETIMACSAFASSDDKKQSEYREWIAGLLKANYSGAGKTLTELPILESLFYVEKK